MYNLEAGIYVCIYAIDRCIRVQPDIGCQSVMHLVYLATTMDRVYTHNQFHICVASRHSCPHTFSV